MSRVTLFLLFGLPLILIYLAIREPEWYLGNYPIAVVGCLFYLPLITLWAIFKVFVYPFAFSPLRHLPEPKDAGWLWAHAKQMRKNHNGYPSREWIHDAPNTGLIRYRVLFNQERVLLASTEALREVLVTNSYEYTKPGQASYIFRKILGDGLLVADGSEHKRQRKILMPAFSFRHIKDLYPVFWSKAIKSTDAIASAITKPSMGKKPSHVQNTYDWASRVTLDIIGMAGMGYDFNSIEQPSGELYTTYHELFMNEPPLFRWLMIGVWVPVDYIFGFLVMVYPQIKNSAQKVRAVAFDLIHQKRALAAKGKDLGVDILSVAMESGGLSDDDLANQIMTFLAAGHETTASALTWTTYLLCKNPDVQTRLREEIRSQLVEDGVLKSSTDALEIDRLPYLNAVCNEVLRIMPSVPATLRTSDHDTIIQGQRIPKGTVIMASPWATNANKEFWGEDALGFNPNRWLDEEGKASKSGGAVNNFANLTFLHGPRSCIGKDFARSELLCLVAAWFGRFEVELENPAQGVDGVGWVTLRPSDGLPVRFSQVKR